MITGQSRNPAASTLQQKRYKVIRRTRSNEDRGAQLSDAEYRSLFWNHRQDSAGDDCFLEDHHHSSSYDDHDDPDHYFPPSSSAPRGVATTETTMALEKKRTLLLLLTLSFSLTLNVYYSFFPTNYGTTTRRRRRFDGSSNPSNSTTGNNGSRSHDHQQDGSIILHYEPQDFQPFNETNPYSSSWCPRTTCHNSPLCAPCNRRFLFILSTGRSGSTSLLKMMNKLPNVQLSGENRNELFYANRLVRNLKFSNAFNFEEGNKDGAWLHNPIPTQAMACVMQKLMTTIDPPPHDALINLNTPDHPSLEEYERSKILGAKMIRIQVGDWDPEEEAVEYFQENFPCARYIVNYSSDIQRQVKSRLNLKWGPDDYETQKKTLLKENEFLKNFARLMGPDRAQLIDMTEWTRDVSILNNILKWMGYRKCHFQNILHDNDLKFEPDSTVPNISKKCHYPHDIV